NRREFLKLAAAGMCVAPALPLLAQSTAPAATETHAIFDRYFLEILGGFLRNAHKTSPDIVVCDFPDGTKLKGCCTPSGKTYVSVARMLPAMVEWIIGGRAPGTFDVKGKPKALLEIVLNIYRNAFNPNHADFWGNAPANKATQLSV